MARVSEAYWQSIVHTGRRVPPDRSLDESTVELVEMLGHPNPRFREHIAYPLLTAWLSSGVYDDLLVGLGDGLTPGLSYRLQSDGDLSVFRRSYSALLLAEVISRDNNMHLVGPETLLNWGEHCADWFVRERDHRAWIAQSGWAQTITHGADLIAVLARSRHFDKPELTGLLHIIGDRLTAATSYVWRHGESDRLAYAAMTLLHRGLIDYKLIEAWLERLGAAIRLPRTRGHIEQEWPSPSAANTSAFLRALHLQLALGVQGRTDLRGDDQLFAEQPDRRADLLLSVLDQIRSENPWLYRVQTGGHDVGQGHRVASSGRRIAGQGHNNQPSRTTTSLD